MVSSAACSRASAPLCATPAARNPPTRSTNRRWISATMKSSSTTSTSRIVGTSGACQWESHLEDGAAVRPVRYLHDSTELGTDQPHQCQSDASAAWNVRFGGDAAG